MISLGLKRISTLLERLNNPHHAFKAVQIAGTNGKGSVCAYISKGLQSSNVTSGRFNSPHLFHRWDCITINEKVVDEGLFRLVEQRVMAANDKDLDASPFELLTATAFEVFRQANISIAVIETGVGGRQDATNVFDAPLVTAITAVGLDHQNLLGTTLGEIASEKAGIIKPNAPVVLDISHLTCDDTSKPILLESEKVCSGTVSYALPFDVDHRGSIIALVDASTHKFVMVTCPGEEIRPSLLGSYQIRNAAIAVGVLKTLSVTYPSITGETIRSGIANASWPGRLELLNDSVPTTAVAAGWDGSYTILLDGAHNAQAAHELKLFVEKVRERRQVIWVMAFSQGKDYSSILQILLESHAAVSKRQGDSGSQNDPDAFYAASFGSVDGMPWVKCTDPAKILRDLRCMPLTKQMKLQQQYLDGSTILDEVRAQVSKASEAPLVVICGSLYLVGQFRHHFEGRSKTQ